MKQQRGLDHSSLDLKSCVYVWHMSTVSLRQLAGSVVHFLRP